MKSSTKAWLVALAFSIVGVTSLLFNAPSSTYLISHILFYTVLTLNSFFSIRLFSAIQPHTTSQTVVDVLLFVIYILLAFSIGRATLFAFLALCVFVAATPKYALMLNVVREGSLLKRKILIDCSGIALCTIVLGGTFLGYESISAWFLAGIFTLANVYFLFIRPMYRLG